MEADLIDLTLIALFLALLICYGAYILLHYNTHVNDTRIPIRHRPHDPPKGESTSLMLINCVPLHSSKRKRPGKKPDYTPLAQHTKFTDLLMHATDCNYCGEHVAVINKKCKNCGAPVK